MNPLPLLSLLPDELPFTFDSLSAEQKEWRGRLFLMVWILYGDEAFSWWAALAPRHTGEAGMRRVVAETPDDLLAEVFAAAWEERRRW